MANAIDLITLYVPLLDEKYAIESVTSILDADPQLVDKTMEGNIVKLPKMTISGLGTHNRNTGYADGDCSIEWESHTFTMDRSRKFSVDRMDNIETAGIAFGRLAGQFIRTKVAPEVDSYRISKYLSLANTTEEEVLTSETVLAAVDAGIASMDDAEVPAEGRVLFVSVEVYNMLKSAVPLRFEVQTGNGTMDRRITLFDGMPIVKVPAARFYSEYDFLDGRTAGQEEGGAVPKDDAVAINFLIVQQDAVMQITKATIPKIIDPMANQSGDAWMFFYRIYHDCFVPDNKVEGVYASIKPVS